MVELTRVGSSPNTLPWSGWKLPAPSGAAPQHDETGHQTDEPTEGAQNPELPVTQLRFGGDEVLQQEDPHAVETGVAGYGRPYRTMSLTQRCEGQRPRGDVKHINKCQPSRHPLPKMEHEGHRHVPQGPHRPSDRSGAQDAMAASQLGVEPPPPADLLAGPPSRGDRHR